MPRKRFTVEITQEHINTAKPRNSGHCMIADAVRASIPGATRVSVDLQTIRWTDSASRRRYVCFTPAHGQEALLDFDHGKPTEPFILSLTPVQIVKTGTQHGPRQPSDRKRVATTSARHPVIIEGGRTPPLAVLSNRTGQRREYGLKQTRR